MRRFMPWRPNQAMGRNTRLKKTNMSQKCRRPSRSLYMRPTIFGYQ